MLARLSFLLIALFWVTMNVVLWRAEYGSADAAGSPVPASVVWQKILSAPDSSSLTILQRNKRIGFCRWSTAVSEELAEMDEAPLAGSPEKLRKYRLRFDGDFTFPASKERLRFESGLVLSNSTDWAEFNLRVRTQLLVILLRSRAGEQTLRFSLTNAEQALDQVFTFAELQDPQAFLGALAGPGMSGILKQLDLPATPNSRLSAVNWESRFDTLDIAHQPVRVYRLQAKIMNGLGIVIYASRVGEILRVELPDGIVLLHDRLLTF